MDVQNTKLHTDSAQNQLNMNSPDEDLTNLASNDNGNTDNEPALVTEYVSDWISLKDYANELGISYEAVRQQVNKKQSELEGHIKNIG